MLTPQEIQEKTFAKAVFGGYDMQTVDEFVEPLAQDYITLYKENAVLKSKLKVLVKKLEEYRDNEQSMKSVIVTAQKTCDTMIQETEEKCKAMLRDAENKAASLHTDELVAQEQERLDCAKQTALNFIDVIEQDIRGHLELLESLKTRDLALEKKEAAAKKAYDFETEAPKEEAPVKDTAREIASQIQENLSKLGLTDEEELAEDVPAETTASDSPTIKFSDLQFGRNYDPKANK